MRRAVKKRGVKGGDDAVLPLSVDKGAAPASALLGASSSRGSCCTKLIFSVVVGVLFINGVLAAMQYARSSDPCDVALEARMRHSKDARVNIIPKIVHQQWKTDTIDKKDQAAWHAKWKALYPEPEYTHILWTDERAREMIVTHFPWFLEQYDAYPHGIQRADAARYFFMWLHGGVYADADYEPLVNFWSSLPPGVGLIQSPYQYNEKVQNSLMSSTPKHPFWNYTFATLKQQFRFADINILKSTGPAMLDLAISAAEADGVPYDVLPCENFQRIPLGTAGWNSPFLTIVAREILGRLPIVKSCGSISSSKCHYGIHHNTVTYMKFGIIAN